MNKVQNSVYGMLLLIKRGKQCIYFASIFKVRYILECIAFCKLYNASFYEIVRYIFKIYKM